jgi:ABC-type sugar transport system ATPase subunit
MTATAASDDPVLRVDDERPVLRVQDATVYSDGVYWLEHASFDVPAGARAALLGTDPAELQAAIRLVAGLDPLRAGRVIVGGDDVTRAKLGRRKAALIFEGGALLPHKTIRDNIGFALAGSGLGRTALAERIAASAKRLDILPYLDLKPAQVPVWVRRQAGLARAMARTPVLYLLDPVAKWKTESEESLRAMFDCLQAERTAAILFAAYDAAEAMQLADWLIVFDVGRVVQQGKPKALAAAPATLAVARLLLEPSHEFFSGHIAARHERGLSIALDCGETLELPLGNTAGEPGEAVTLAAPQGALRKGAAGLGGARVMLFDSMARALS